MHCITVAQLYSGLAYCMRYIQLDNFDTCSPVSHHDTVTLGCSLLWNSSRLISVPLDFELTNTAGGANPTAEEDMSTYTNRTDKYLPLKSISSIESVCNWEQKQMQEQYIILPLLWSRNRLAWMWPWVGSGAYRDVYHPRHLINKQWNYICLVAI